MEEKYGNIVLRRVNKAGMICFLIAGILILLFVVLDTLWVNGVIPLPTIFQVQYQPIYLLWFIFVFICLGIDKIVISDKGFTISTLFAKKEETEKTAMAYVLENDDKLYLVPIVATLGLSNPVDYQFLKRRNGVLIISSKYKEKLIERGYEIQTSI